MAGLVRQAAYFLGITHEGVAGGSQGDSGGTSLEQVRAHLVFQLFNAAAHRGLRRVQESCRAVHAAFAGNDTKVFQGQGVEHAPMLPAHSG